MCPVCLASLAVTVATTTGIGAATAAAARKLVRRRTTAGRLAPRLLDAHLARALEVEDGVVAGEGVAVRGAAGDDVDRR